MSGRIARREEGRRAEEPVRAGRGRFYGPARSSGAVDPERRHRMSHEMNEKELGYTPDSPAPTLAQLAYATLVLPDPPGASTVGSRATMAEGRSAPSFRAPALQPRGRPRARPETAAVAWRCTRPAVSPPAPDRRWARQPVAMAAAPPPEAASVGPPRWPHPVSGTSGPGSGRQRRLRPIRPPVANRGFEGPTSDGARVRGPRARSRRFGPDRPSRRAGRPSGGVTDGPDRPSVSPVTWSRARTSPGCGPIAVEPRIAPGPRSGGRRHGRSRARPARTLPEDAG